jgi:hypothetical protein
MRCFQLHTEGNTADKSLAFVDQPPDGLGLYDVYLSEGDPIGDRYPANARISLRPSYPGIRLSSLLGNCLCFLIVNTAIKDIFVAEAKAAVEALPFTLLNHKKRVHSRDYWIINPLAIVDCVDKEHSEIVYFDESKTTVVAVNKFVFDARKLEGQPPLFRVPEARTEYFITVELARALKQHDFSNMRVSEIEVRNGSPQ